MPGHEMPVALQPPTLDAPITFLVLALVILLGMKAYEYLFPENEYDNDGWHQ